MNKIILLSAVAIIVVIIAILSYEFIPSHSNSSQSSKTQLPKNVLIPNHNGGSASIGASSFNISKVSNNILVDNFTYSDIINFSKNNGEMWKIYTIASSLPAIVLQPGVSTYTITKNSQLTGVTNNSNITINANGHLVFLEIYGKNDTITFNNGILFYPYSSPGLIVEVNNNSYVIK